MAEVLSISEIRARYDSEWILLADPETSDDLEIRGGTVLWHSKDRDEVYRKARQLRPRRAAFLYTGKLPKDAAIVLLADAVEAASRTLEEPSPARIQEVVNQIVRRRLSDGQLDESGLTLTDIKRIEETFTRVLMGIFHTRIKYQKERTAR